MNALDIKAIDISAHNEKQFAAKSASHDNDDNNGNAKATATSNRQKSRQKKKNHKILNHKVPKLISPQTA